MSPDSQLISYHCATEIVFSCSLVRVLWHAELGDVFTMRCVYALRWWRPVYCAHHESHGLQPLVTESTPLHTLTHCCLRTSTCFVKMIRIRRHYRNCLFIIGFYLIINTIIKSLIIFWSNWCKIVVICEVAGSSGRVTLLMGR